MVYLKFAFALADIPNDVLQKYKIHYPLEHIFFITYTIAMWVI